jgi:hypothetical protein
MARPSIETAREWAARPIRARMPSRRRKGLPALLPAMPGRARARTGPLARRRGRRRGGTVLLEAPRAALRSMPKPPPLPMPRAPSLSMPKAPRFSMPKAPSLSMPKVRSARRRRARGVAGNLGMAVGAGAGYLLGTRAGRERYQQIVGQARQLWERPQVKDLAAKGRDRLGAGVARAAGSAGDRLQHARERSERGPSGGGPAQAG